MIIPALIRIFEEFKNVKLFLMGEIDLPNELEKYSSKIIKKSFLNWKKLPTFVSRLNINIAPIKESIFNEAKSENKWLEASLVKAPTIACNFGDFKKVIRNGETGCLCSNNEEWYKALKRLIIDKRLQKTIAKNAFEICKEQYNLLSTGYKLSNHINSVPNKHIGFILPSLQISGGVRVILMHAIYLQDEGWDVDLVLPQSIKENIDLFEFKGHKLNVIILKKTKIEAQYDILVATLYSTLYKVLSYYKIKRKL